MAIEIITSFVIIDFTKNGNDQSEKLDTKLNDGWFINETYQFEMALVYELRKYNKV